MYIAYIHSWQARVQDIPLLGLQDKFVIPNRKKKRNKDKFVIPNRKKKKKKTGPRWYIMADRYKMAPMVPYI